MEPTEHSWSLLWRRQRVFPSCFPQDLDKCHPVPPFHLIFSSSPPTAFCHLPQFSNTSFLYLLYSSNTVSFSLGFITLGKKRWIVGVQVQGATLISSVCGQGRTKKSLWNCLFPDFFLRDFSLDQNISCQYFLIVEGTYMHIKKKKDKH